MGAGANELRKVYIVIYCSMALSNLVSSVLHMAQECMRGLGSIVGRGASFAFVFGKYVQCLGFVMGSELPGHGHALNAKDAHTPKKDRMRYWYKKHPKRYVCLQPMDIWI